MFTDVLLCTQMLMVEQGDAQHVNSQRPHRSACAETRFDRKSAEDRLKGQSDLAWLHRLIAPHLKFISVKLSSCLPRFRLSRV